MGMDYSRAKDWIVAERGFEPEHLGKCESIMCQGNGYLCLRNATDEFNPREQRDLFVAGTFNKFDDNEVTELPNAADVSRLEIKLDGQRFSLLTGTVEDYDRTLDLKTGETVRKVVWKAPNGRRYELCFRRFVSMERLHVIGQKLCVRPLDGEALLDIAGGIDGRMTNSGSQHFSEGDKRLFKGRHMQYSQTTGQSKIDFVFNTTFSFAMDGEAREEPGFIVIDRRMIAQEYQIDLVELKALLTKWQKELDGKAWNSLYWCNHDQPRIVSRLGNDSTPELREKSAKAIALTIHMMQGTPYVYEGEELAMTNAPFGGLEDFRDIESINAYNELVGSGRMGSEEMLGFLRYKSRDNSRTPMQWDAGKNAGFSEGEPWIMVNPNYREINAAEQLARPDSVFRFYQELIRLRHTHKLIVYGSYDLILPEDRQLFAYTRTLGDQRLLCVVNLSDEPAACEVPEEFAAAQKLIEVGQPSISGGRAELAPWDAFVLAIL